MRWVSLLILAVFAAPLQGSESRAIPASDPGWVAHPAVPGPNLPPVGRSLFDQLFINPSTGAYDLPYPFTDLLRRIDGHRAGTDGRELQLHDLFDHTSSLLGVVIPFSRSLQKEAAAPEYYQFPRIIVGVNGGVDGSNDDAMPTAFGNKLFIGYSEAARALEVISYNEAAQRFEFQVVKNYGPGQVAQVTYADRKLCVSCHQGHGPIFNIGEGREDWEDTTSDNFRLRESVEEALGRAKDQHPERFTRGQYNYFYWGVPLEGQSALLDTSIRMGNVHLLMQRFWRDYCVSVECRATFVKLALMGESKPEEKSPLGRLVSSKFKRLRHGLILPSSFIGNHAPTSTAFERPVLDPITPRLFYDVDGEFDEIVPTLHQIIYAREFDGPGFVLDGGLRLDQGDTPDSAEVDEFLALSMGPLIRHVEKMERAKVEAAVDRLFKRPELSARNAPFSAALFMNRLARELQISEPGFDRLILATPSLPRPELEPAPREIFTKNAILNNLSKNCASCHGRASSAIPNFLYVPPEHASRTDEYLLSKLRACSERAWFRLKQWHLPQNSRKTGPMPPEASEEQIGSRDLKALMAFFERLNQSQNRNPSLETPYQQLAPCR